MPGTDRTAGSGLSTKTGAGLDGGRPAVRVHRERLVAAPPDRVFAVAGDAEALPRWNSCMAARNVQGGFDRVGSSFDATLDLLGMQFAGRGSVVAAEPGRLVRIRVDCTEHGGTSEWTYRFAPVGGATHCSIEIACAESGALLVLDHMFGRPKLEAALDRIAAQVLDSLASLSEGMPQPA